jgi:hypothetical protein
MQFWTQWYHEVGNRTPDIQSTDRWSRLVTMLWKDTNWIQLNLLRHRAASVGCGLSDSTCNQLTRLRAQEDFIEFSRRESFKLYNKLNWADCLQHHTIHYVLRHGQFSCLASPLLYNGVVCSVPHSTCSCLCSVCFEYPLPYLFRSPLIFSSLLFLLAIFSFSVLNFPSYSFSSQYVMNPLFPCVCGLYLGLPPCLPCHTLSGYILFPTAYIR